MASSSTNAKGKEPLRSISGNHSGSGDESSYGDQSGYGDDSGCEDHSGYVDHSQSGEFPSYDTPPEFFNSNGSYDSLEFESGNWVYNRAMTPRWSQRPICTFNVTVSVSTMYPTVWFIVRNVRMCCSII